MVPLKESVSLNVRSGLNQMEIFSINSAAFILPKGNRHSLRESCPEEMVMEAIQHAVPLPRPQRPKGSWTWWKPRLMGLLGSQIKGIGPKPSNLVPHFPLLLSPPLKKGSGKCKTLNAKNKGMSRKGLIESGAWRSGRMGDRGRVCREGILGVRSLT